jgi:glycolate oxidase FAD binding subunit
VTGAAHLPGDRTIIRIEGFATSITYRLGQLRRVLKAFGTPDVIEGEAAAELWRGIRDGAPLVEPRDHAVWRISTTPTMGPGLVEAIADAIETRCYYDWSGGLVWLATPATGDAGAAAIRGALARAGGHATLVRAPVEVRAAIDVFQPLSEPLMRVSAGVKASLDPAGIFNPGRMYAGV